MFFRHGSGLARPVRRALFRRAVAIAITSVIGVIAVGSFEAGPAGAHATLRSSSPGEGAVVDAVPAQVVLTFDEVVHPLPDRVRVLAPDGARADLGTASIFGPSIRITLHPSQIKGTYVVSYAVSSSDNHAVEGAYTFFVGTPSPARGSVGESPRTLGGWSSIAQPAVRLLGYLGLSLLVGAALMLGSLWPRRGDQDRATRIMWAGVVIIGGTTMIDLGLEILIAAGGDSLRWSDIQSLLTSRSGVAQQARLAVLLAAVWVLGPIARGTATRWQRITGALLFTAGMASYPLAGHPGETQAPVISILSDALHVAAMSLWLGGLIMLVTFVLPRAEDDELGTIVPMWSIWAGYAVFTLLLSGIAQSILQIGRLSLLLDTGYGRLVLAKTGSLAAILLIALGSRRVAAAMARRETGGAPRLRRLVLAESAGVLVILALTAVLVQTPPARAADAAQTANSVTRVRMTSALASVQLTLDPGRRGLNRLDLHALAPDGTPLHVRVWSGTATQPSRRTKGVDLGLLALTPDHAVGQVRLPAAGTWRLTLTLVDSDLNSATMTSAVTVR